MSTISGLCAASASSPDRTESWRVAPPNTGASSRNAADERRNTSWSSGWMTGWTSAIPSCPENVASDRSIAVPPSIGRYCLGAPPPARRPRPAATTTAATVVIGPLHSTHQATAPPRPQQRLPVAWMPQRRKWNGLTSRHAFGVDTQPLVAGNDLLVCRRYNVDSAGAQRFAGARAANVYNRPQQPPRAVVVLGEGA